MRFTRTRLPRAALAGGETGVGRGAGETVREEAARGGSAERSG